MTKKVSVADNFFQQQNMKALQRIQREASQRSETWLTGQWVGLVHGKVVVASADWKEVVAAVEKVACDRRQAMLFRIGDNYDEVERIHHCH